MILTYTCKILYHNPNTDETEIQFSDIRKKLLQKYYYLECSVNTFHLNWKLSLRFEANKVTLTVINIGIVASDLDPIYDYNLKHWLPFYGKCSLKSSMAASARKYKCTGKLLHVASILIDKV